MEASRARPWCCCPRAAWGSWALPLPPRVTQAEAGTALGVPAPPAVAQGQGWGRKRFHPASLPTLHQGQQSVPSWSCKYLPSLLLKTCPRG